MFVYMFLLNSSGTPLLRPSQQLMSDSTESRVTSQESKSRDRVLELWGCMGNSKSDSRRFRAFQARRFQVLTGGFIGSAYCYSYSIYSY